MLTIAGEAAAVGPLQALLGHLSTLVFAVIPHEMITTEMDPFSVFVSPVWWIVFGTRLP